jgi:adenosylhomocysteine nucleosidase
MNDDNEIACKQPATLVCFAVKEEAKPFQRLIGSRPDIKVLVTGMGQQNAERAIQSALEKQKFALVLTCGFAGGLNPDLESGEVVFLTALSDLDEELLRLGAKRAHFLCCARVVTTQAEKSRLWQQEQADAVEMESVFIVDACARQHIPHATVRVILDTANEDLVLDFNKLMTPDMRMDGKKLAWEIIKSPGKIPALMRLGKQSNAAAEKLATVLAEIVTE